MTDEKQNSKIANTEANGRERFGEHWNNAINAIGRVAAPKGGIPEAEMRSILDGPDAAGTFYQVGRAALCDQIQSIPGQKIDPDLEAQYSEMRQREREQFRKRRGW
jgi:hypothetical protein